MSSFLIPITERKNLRRSIRTRCQVVTERDFFLVSEQTLDISPHGMLLRASQALPDLGENVYISLRTPRSRQWIDAEGEIVRLVHGRRLTDRHRGVGVRFTKLDPMAKALLHGSLPGHPPPVPARGERIDIAATVRAIAAS